MLRDKRIFQLSSLQTRTSNAYLKKKFKNNYRVLQIHQEKRLKVLDYPSESIKFAFR